MISSFPLPHDWSYHDQDHGFVDVKKKNSCNSEQSVFSCYSAYRLDPRQGTALAYNSTKVLACIAFLSTLRSPAPMAIALGMATASLDMIIAGCFPYECQVFSFVWSYPQPFLLPEGIFYPFILLDGPSFALVLKPYQTGTQEGQDGGHSRRSPQTGLVFASYFWSKSES